MQATAIEFQGNLWAFWQTEPWETGWEVHKVHKDAITQPVFT